MENKKKVLILSCNTGGGHNAAGKAVCSELVSRNVECEMMDFYAITSPVISKGVSNSYLGIIKRVPRLFGVMYNAAGAIKFKRVKSAAYFVNSLQAIPLRKIIEENGYNVVVMPHIFPSQALTSLEKHSDTKVLSISIGTDYDYVPFSQEVSPDYFVLPHADIKGQYIKEGIPESKLLSIGIPVNPSFTVKIEKSEARRQLGIAKDKNCVLIMSGSMGFGDAGELMEGLIARYGENISIVMLGGNNEKLKRSVRERFAKYPAVKVVDFTSKVSLFMDAADVILTKPGGLTTTEFAAKGVPAIFTKPIPGCETKNAQFFTSRGMALNCPSTEEQLAAIHYLLNNDDARRAMVRAQRENINQNSARDLCDFILSR